MRILILKSLGDSVLVHMECTINNF